MRATYKLLDIVTLSLQSLLIHKGRSALTALGIIIGVMGVIATLAISEGGSVEAQRALLELGSDNIIIDSVKPQQEQSSASGANNRIQEYGLTRQDIDALTSNIPGVHTYSIVHRTRGDARVEERVFPKVVVIATDPDYFAVARIKPAQGRLLCPADAGAASAVCVMTQTLARNVFQYEDPLNNSVWVNGQPFVVVGLIDKVPRTLVEQAGDTDNCLIVPWATGEQRFGPISYETIGRATLMEKVFASQIILQMQDEKSLIGGVEIARNLLAKAHPGGQEYRITIPYELIEQQRKQRKLWNFVFLAVAMISLIVGGIGIMNITLAAVTERTREIGIRRAMGARRRDIVVQFLVESMTLAMVGGVAGVAIGVAVPWAVRTFFNFTTIITASTLVLPLLVSVLVGLLSGLYPAVRAANLDPITALRHE